MKTLHRNILAIAFSLLTTTSIAESSAYQLTGKIIPSERKDNIILEINFKNNSGKSACLQYWSDSKSIPADTTYQDMFSVKDYKGKLARYISRKGDFDIENQNIAIFIVPQNKTISAKYNLTELYELSSGSFSVSYLLGVVDCEAYNSNWIYIPRPNNLKYLYSVKEYDIDAINNLYSKDKEWSKYGRIIELKPVKFEILRN
ncbi:MULTISPECIES: hypothetical protein [unclassified Microbulbifer]|uniref:hypothetical protein n=1 Tax=unclassified Microbulbifer TaxID=2619833 RepID=UPI0027E52398|nr:MULTISPECIES: hypothetical protein [unclassified Microbulbifer]